MSELSEIKEKVSQIYTAIAGNPQLGNKGIVQTQEDHESRLIKLERFRNSLKKWGWIKTGAIAGATAALSHSSGIKAVLSKIASFALTGLLTIVTFLAVYWIL